MRLSRKWKKAILSGNAKDNGVRLYQKVCSRRKAPVWRSSGSQQGSRSYGTSAVQNLHISYVAFPIVCDHWKKPRKKEWNKNRIYFGLCKQFFMCKKIYTNLEFENSTEGDFGSVILVRRSSTFSGSDHQLVESVQWSVGSLARPANIQLDENPIRC